MRFIFALLVYLMLPSIEGRSIGHFPIDEITSNQGKEHIDTLLVQAASYKKERNYQHAIRLYSQALEIALGKKDYFRQSTVHYYLGEIYLDINNRSEEHTSELQSRENLVCRLLL